MEGLGRNSWLLWALLFLPTTLLAGSSISHRLLQLFPQCHTWSRSVRTRWHRVRVVSLSPAPRPSSSASLCNLWEHRRVTGTRCRGPMAMLCPPCCPCQHLLCPQHPPWLAAPAAMRPLVNICQKKKILGDKRAGGFSG